MATSLGASQLKVSSVREYIKKGLEAEESLLLEAYARKWLVKTQQAGKELAGVMVICGD
jgi:hypothetical protein